MKNKRMLRILALVVVLSMIFTTAAFATPGNKQLKRDDENYRTAFTYLIEKEIMKGYGHGEYGLEGNVKRGDVIVMIVRAFDLEGDFDAEKLGINFLDLVDEYDYMYKPVGIAKKLGIAKGDGLYFKPNKPVTVQEAIWLIARAGELVDDNELNTDDEDLEDLFDNNELNKFAKRKDIALMLHYVIKGDTEEDNIEDDDVEIDVVKYTLEDDEDEKDFDAQDFVDAYSKIKAYTENDLKYIMFTSGNEVLRYDDDEREIVVNKTNKYFVNEEKGRGISNITYIREDNFSGIVEIEYLAYDKNDKSYPGLIKITVDGDEMLDDMEFPIKENTILNFKETDFEDNIDKVKFDILDKKIGTLYFDDDNNNVLSKGDDKIAAGDDFDYGQLDEIFFLPHQDITGKAVIGYTAVDGDDTYTGEIKITVQEVQEIDTLKIPVDEDNDDGIIFDFVTLLDSLTDNDEIFTQDVFADIDHVKFVLPTQGTLSIDIGDGYEVVNKGEYVFGSIDDLKYVPVVDFDDVNDTVEIEFTALDGDKEYDGVIEITVTE